MAESSSKPAPVRKRRSITDFDPEFGDLSPVPDIKGPKVALNRQALRLFLHFFGQPAETKTSSSRAAIDIILQHHIGDNDPMKQRGKLELNIIKLYDNTKSVIHHLCNVIIF